MDLQSLTIVHVNDHRSAGFDPKTEDDYYDAVIDFPSPSERMTGWMSRARGWMRAFWPTGQWNTRRLRNARAMNEC